MLQDYSLDFLPSQAIDTYFVSFDASLSIFAHVQKHIVYLFLRQGLSPSPRLEYSGRDFLDSGDSSTSASQVAGTTGMHHHTWLIFVFLVEMRFHHVAQAALEFLASSHLLISASQSSGITGLRHHPWLLGLF